MHRLQGKVAVIFGSATGIGRATAEEFVRQGATVYGSDLMSDVPGIGPAYRHSRVDATEEEDVNDFVARVVEAESRIDVCFNNVGGGLQKKVSEASLDDFEYAVRINLRTVFLGTRAVLPHMLAQQKGSIISTSSNGGLMGRPNDPVYNATKHGVVGLMKSVAVAHAAEGIRANTVNPGPIDTPMLRSILPEGRELEEPEITRLIVASTPAARIGAASDIAQAVVFLASDESTFVNGVALAIDGGKAAGALPSHRYAQDFDLGVSP
jgi:NAD(P)-dependent dehydrogenase (short-subunit alcohol dehydrogenase family)